LEAEFADQANTKRNIQPLLKSQWKHLKQGNFVDARFGKTMIRSGWVDEVTPDGTSIWINLVRGMGRVLIHHDEVVELSKIDA
jgi:hypothetical protein